MNTGRQSRGGVRTRAAAHDKDRGAAWIYEVVGPDGERISGIQYLSRHGDDFVLWAIYERGMADSPPEVTARDEPCVILPTTKLWPRRCAYIGLPGCRTTANGRTMGWRGCGAHLCGEARYGPRIRAYDTLLGALVLCNGR